jgi:hypothetical protein
VSARNNISRELHPSGLWSLWDMLETYGRNLFRAADALSTARSRLYLWNSQNKSERYLPADQTAIRAEVAAALRHAKDVCGQLPLGKIAREIDRVTAENSPAIIVERCGVALRNISERFHDELEDQKFLHVPDALASFYEQKALFGPVVFDKFKDTRDDIKQAGNCYALGQSTAAVFHMMRAMETVVRRLARRPHMNITIAPKTTWRMITGAMDDKIKAMPEKTAQQKRKRELWETARTTLHHVGSIWRNGTMHPAKSYSQPQAREILDACKVFMIALCEL